jgi:hypothetical protein
MFASGDQRGSRFEVGVGGMFDVCFCFLRLPVSCVLACLLHCVLCPRKDPRECVLSGPRFSGWRP